MRPPRTTRRKAGTTSSHHAPYDLGYTRTTMGVNKEKRNREGEQTSKTHPQFRSQAATRLREAGIASNRWSKHTAVNTFPGLVHTARHTMRVRNTRSR